MNSRSLAKDFYRLQKNITSFTNNEAKITDFDDNLTHFDIELKIKDGYYKNALFIVNIRPLNYPKNAPRVSFNTRIYHPNIDDGFCRHAVCLNLIDEDWTEKNDLEDVVHALLFLVKNPNFNDPLNPLFSEEYIMENELAVTSFERDVRISLEGGEVDGIVFPRNPGFDQLHIKENEVNDGKLIEIKTENNTNEITVQKEREDFAVCEETTNVRKNSVEILRTETTLETVHKFDEKDITEIKFNEKNPSNLYINHNCPNNLVSISKMPLGAFDKEWKFYYILRNNGISSRTNKNIERIRCEKNTLLHNWLVHLFHFLRTRENSNNVQDKIQEK